MGNLLQKHDIASFIVMKALHRSKRGVLVCQEDILLIELPIG